MSMTEQNKAIVRRQFTLISEGDARGAALLFAPVSMNHGRQMDRKVIVFISQSLVAMQMRFNVHELVAEGDWVACRVTVTGKHVTQPEAPIDSGIYSLVSPTGKVFAYQHLHLFKIIDEQIVEHWANRDDLGVARQLGFELHFSQPSTNL